MGQGRGRAGESVTIIERTAESLPGGRAQLVERVWIDGEQRPELTVRRGSSAAADVVRQHEETVTIGDEGVRRRRPDGLDYDPACPACGGIDVRRDQFRIRRCADCGAVIR